MPQQKNLTQEEIDAMYKGATGTPVQGPKRPGAALTPEEMAAKYPGDAQTIMNMKIEAQRPQNVREQTFRTHMQEPVWQKEEPHWLVPGKPDWLPDPIWGAAKHWGGHLVGAVNLGGRKLAENLESRLRGGTTGASPFNPLLKAAFPDPYENIARAGRPGAYPEPFSMVMGEGQDFMFGPSGGSQSPEAGGAEVARAMEYFFPTGRAIKGAAAIGEKALRLPATATRGAGMRGLNALIQGLPRSAAEALATIGLGAAHGEEVGKKEVALTAGAPLVGRLAAGITQKLSPGTAEWLEKQGRSFYGGVFNPKDARERAIAAEAIDPLIESQKGYFGGAIKAPKGIYTTRGQMERLAQNRLMSGTQEKALSINARGGPDFPLDLDAFEQDLQWILQNRLTARNPNIGKRVFRGPEAEDTWRRLEDLRNRARELSEVDPITGQRTVPYQAMMNFKDEADMALEQGGFFAEHSGDPIVQAANRARRHGAGAIRDEVARDAPEIAAVDQYLSEWSNVAQGLSMGELRGFGRVAPGNRPTIANVGENAIGRGITYAQYKAAFGIWDRIRASPLFRTSIGKGIAINVANALKRGDFDGAAGLIGKVASYIEGRERRFPEEAQSPVQPKEEDVWIYDPATGTSTKKAAKK